MSKILKVTAVIGCLLLLHGCATYNGGKWMQPVLDGNITLIQSYIDNGEHLTYQDKYGLTPLHTAVHNGDVSIVKLLIDAGANVNATSGLFGSPLNYAASSRLDHTETINLLLAHGADIHKRVSMAYPPHRERVSEPK
jgi:ankyrin repeat protein